MKKSNVYFLFDWRNLMSISFLICRWERLINNIIIVHTVLYWNCSSEIFGSGPQVHFCKLCCCAFIWKAISHETFRCVIIFLLNKIICSSVTVHSSVQGALPQKMFIVLSKKLFPRKKQNSVHGALLQKKAEFCSWSSSPEKGHNSLNSSSRYVFTPSLSFKWCRGFY